MRQTEAIRVTGVSVCVSVKEAVLIQTSDIQGLLPLWYIRRLFFRRNHVTMRKIRRKLSCRHYMHITVLAPGCPDVWTEI